MFQTQASTSQAGDKMASPSICIWANKSTCRIHSPLFTRRRKTCPLATIRRWCSLPTWAGITIGLTLRNNYEWMILMKTLISTIMATSSKPLTSLSTWATIWNHRKSSCDSLLENISGTILMLTSQTASYFIRTLTIKAGTTGEEKVQIGQRTKI